MQIQPSPVPLANTGTTQSAVPEAPPAAKSDSARPVESAPKDPAAAVSLSGSRPGAEDRL